MVHQVQALQLLVLLLPEAHRETLRVSSPQQPITSQSDSDIISQAVTSLLPSSY